MNLEVQSWLNGPHAYSSNCTNSTASGITESFSVFNVHNTSITGVKFSTHSDHSKWAVASNYSSSGSNFDDKVQWVCTADLNRMVILTNH